MTGYGLSSSIKGNSEVSVEIKGVNHRFLEISLKSNDISNDIDQYIRNIVGKNIIRGKVDIKIKFKSPQFAVTPGQSAVFYKDDLLLGGGIISK